MRRIKLEYIIAWLLLIVWGLIVLHAPLTVWLVSHGAPVGIKAWKEAVMVLAALLLLIHVWRQKKFSLFTRDTLIWAAAMYGLINLIMALCMPTSLAATLAGLAINLRYVLYFVLVYVFIRLHPEYMRSFLKIGAIGAGIVIGFALLQLVLPHDVLKYLGYSKATISPYLTVDENTAYIRENSTLRGPNPLGAYAGAAAILVLAYMTHRWHTLRRVSQRWLCVGILIASLVALWVSYSRSALIATLIGLVVVVGVKVVRHMKPAHWITLALGTLVLVGAGWAMRDTLFVRNVILHDNPTTGASVDSNGDHVTSLREGWSRMLSQPFGAGVGSTGSASLLSDSGLIIENQYLMIAHEVGWLGLGIFIWLFYLVMAALWRRRSSWLGLGVWTSGLSLALIGLVLPVWTDDTVSIVWWGLAALVVATESKRARHETATTP
jgi:hypothetical protein